MQVRARMRTADKTVRVEVVAEVIDRVLNEVFGRRATRLIYRHLERKYSVKPGEITEKIDLFARGLEDFLDSGGDLVERRILEDVQSSFGLDCQSTPASADFVDQMRLLTGKA